MGAFIRSVIFNIVFYAYTAFICFFLVFSFALPRRQAFTFVRFFYFRAIGVIERLFLDLRWRVSGRENLPEGSYVLALKHYSTYETLKLPVIFGDVAIIMKKELTWIPFWGWYTKKLGMIAVDRGGRQKALASLIANSKRVIAQGRPILIFPQGTRVHPNDTTAEKPYKVGIAKIAETLNLPVVPVALNSGAFWPKHSFLKKSGVVDFKILPVIPAGLPAAEVLKRLEAAIEPESAKLIERADIRKGRMSGWVKFAMFLFVLWFGYWQLVAFTIRDRLRMVPDSITSPYKPTVSGFPGAVHVAWPQVTFTGDNGTLTLPMAEAKVWPLPAGGVTLYADQGFHLETVREGRPVSVGASRFALRFTMPHIWMPMDAWSINLKSIGAAIGGAVIEGRGDIALPLNEGPVNGTLDVSVTNHEMLLSVLMANGMIDRDMANTARGLLGAMAGAGGGTIRAPFSIKDDVVYLSVLRIFDLNDLHQPADAPGMLPQKNHSGGLETNSPPAPAPQTPVPAEQP